MGTCERIYSLGCARSVNSNRSLNCCISGFYSHRSLGAFYPFFPAFFPFHFGFLVPMAWFMQGMAWSIFLIFVIFLVARWIFWPWREENSHCFTPQYHDNAQSILKERYAKGEITKEQFEQMMLDLKRTD
jgi:putative membrane protein